MSDTPRPPADEFKPRSPWGRLPAQTFTLSPGLPGAPKPAPRPQPQPPRRPTSSILSGSALPVGPAYVPPVAPKPEPQAAPEPPPPPIEIHPATILPEPEERTLEEVTVFAPRRKKSPAPWLVGGAVAAVAVAGAAFMLRPQETPVEAEPLAPVAAAPAPEPLIEAPQPVAEPAPAPVIRERAATVARAPSAPRPAVQRTAPPVVAATPAPLPQPVAPTPTPAPTTRLESIVPTPIQPQPPIVRPPVDPNAPLETNDSY